MEYDTLKDKLTNFFLVRKDDALLYGLKLSKKVLTVDFTSNVSYIITVMVCCDLSQIELLWNETYSKCPFKFVD